MRLLSRVIGTHACAAGALRGTPIRRVLVCRPNHRLGNLVLLTPLLQEIARQLPEATIDVVAAGESAAKLLGPSTNVRTVHALSRRVVRHLWATARIAWQIRHAHYDLAIDPCESSQSSRLLVAIAHARHTIAIRDTDSLEAGWAIDPLVGAPHHMAQLPVWSLRVALWGPSGAIQAEYPPLRIELSEYERLDGRKWLNGTLHRHGKDVASGHVIGVFGDATGDKKYARTWWLGLLAALRDAVPDCAIVEILPPDGHPQLSANLPAFASADPRRIGALISCLDGFISADCGLMHLACASGTPTLGLFSVTDQAKYQPYGIQNLGVNTAGKDPGDVACLVQHWLTDTLSAPRNTGALPVTTTRAMSLAIPTRPEAAP